MRVIITGGTGLIGTALTKKLLADGHEIVVLSRNPQKYRLPEGATGVQWDGETAYAPKGGTNWHTYITNDTAIVNLAGASVAGEGLIPSRWTEARKKLIYNSRINVGKAVVAGIEAAEQKPSVLIQASAVGYYGVSDDTVLAEDAPAGNDFLADVCTNWEISTASVAKLGVRRVVTRIGLVMSMEGGPLPLIVLPFKLFVGGPLGNGRQWMPWIHIDDVVGAIQFLIENDDIHGYVNLTAPIPLTNKQMGQTIGKVLGRPSFIPAPAFALKLLLGEVSTVALDGQRVIPQALQKLNYPFQFTEAKVALTDLLK